MDHTHLSETKFSTLALPEALQKSLTEAGYEYCTPIQSQALPHLLEGKDVAGQAQTGTGKTAAFLVAAIQLLLNEPADERRRTDQPRALILAPTRELAVQIHKDAEALTQGTGLRLALVYGGANYEKQREEAADNVDILIGTPGRLIDYFKQKVFDLKAIQAVVLDEADRMFDLGFIKDIRYLFRRMPPPDKRLSMLFSATLSFRVTELAYEHMNNPTQVKIESDSVTADRVEQSVYYTANDEKLPLLVTLIKQQQPERAIIFVNTKRVADRVWALLEGNELKSGLLSGDIPQKKRLSLLNKFQSGELSFLVATDVAARGLHIPAVSHVFNFDLPQNAEDYVHRIGRTARAGASGVAISFACEDSAFYLPDIEEYISAKIPSAGFDHSELVELAPPVKIKHSRPPGPRSGKGGGRNGGRGRRGDKKPGGDKSASSEGGDQQKRRRRRRPKPKQES